MNMTSRLATRQTTISTSATSPPLPAGQSEYSVLIADQQAGDRNRLATELEAVGGFVVTQMSSLVLAKDALLDTADHFDAVLLGSPVNDIEAGLIARDLRRRDRIIPVIVLTELDDEDGVVFALDSGADDAVAKPVRVRELLARLRRHLRRYRDGDQTVLSLGPYEFRPGERTISAGDNGRRIGLTIKECGILDLLHRANGATVMRERLLQEVWGYSSSVTTHTLETHVYRLRQKLEADPARATLLITDSGGYRLAIRRPSRRDA